MKFQYVSNAGIVLRTKEKIIGIDCLCRDLSKIYQDTPVEIREQLKPDILIFTHEHEDHFCTEYAEEAWVKNKELQIYSTKSVIEALKVNGLPLENLYCVEEEDVLDVDKVHINYMYSLHEGEQYSNVQNVTLLIRIEDKHLVITGDAMPCKELFERIAAWSPRVDWLFAPFPYVGLRSTRKLMTEHFDIKNIFVLHQPYKEADTQNWVANTKRVCEVSKDGLPAPIFPDKLGEWYCI